ncbi:tetratricopeptide repeat protein [Streptomyces sp. NPDC051771]|uniref:tetratricopeptide repeat protein n=1 Tax=Streptomyces sp. NPDC051771 TaxID=3154847 RepID=UPI003425FF0F
MSGPGEGVAASGDRAVAAGGDVGMAVTGDHSVAVRVERVTQLPPELFASITTVPCPPGLVNLPFKAGEFVGRARELAALDRSLEASPGVVVQAVHGLGGIGKSTLAAHWAATRTADHDLVWWITAETPAELDAGLAALAVALQPVLLDVDIPLQALRERAVQWLATHGRWLLVLDNVTDPEDVRSLLARVRGGHFLITSRRATGWHGVAAPFALDVLDAREAAELFGRIAGPSADPDRVTELCAELGQLPLAVEQAAAYCAETATDAGAYLRLLARYPAEVYAATAEGGDRRAVARTWRVTLDRLADDPLTGEVLRMLAWYAPDDIPRRLLDPLGSPPAVLRALGRLAAHSMVTLREGHGISLHRLVQAVARTPDREDPHRAAADIDRARTTAAACLAQLLPPPRLALQHGIRMRDLVPHCEALAERVRPADDTRDTAWVLARLGLVHLDWDEPERAVAVLGRALAARTAVDGPDHPTLLPVRHNLAYACWLTGEAERALSLYERVLDDCVTHLGRDDPRTRLVETNMARMGLW